MPEGARTFVVRTASTGPLVAELTGGGPGTAALVLARLPVRSRAMLWGEEVYFEVPFHHDAEPGARADVSVGDVAFWPEGDCLCLFFGRTPASSDASPRAASPVNVFARLTADPRALARVREGDEVEVLPG
jgi:hypothetical protein